jgi:hypothetical protein
MPDRSPTTQSGSGDPPPLGEVYLDPKRTCTRLVGYAPGGKEILCDAPAVRHVDWGEWAGFCCGTHWGEAQRMWSTAADHALGPYCGMPGALWYSCPDGSSYCAYEGDLPTVDPARATAEAPA